MTDEVQIEITGPESLARIRHEVVRIAEQIGFQSREIEGLVTAVSEACANALIHGRGLSEKAPVVTIRSANERFEAVIKDWGPGHACSQQIPMPGPGAPGGRGIPLMQRFVDKVLFRGNCGCEVTLVKYLSTT